MGACVCVCVCGVGGSVCVGVWVGGWVVGNGEFMITF
jgi:hypothetical protein